MQQRLYASAKRLEAGGSVSLDVDMRRHSAGRLDFGIVIPIDPMPFQESGKGLMGFRDVVRHGSN